MVVSSRTYLFLRRRTNQKANAANITTTAAILPNIGQLIAVGVGTGVGVGADTGAGTGSGSGGAGVTRGFEGTVVGSSGAGGATTVKLPLNPSTVTL